MEHCLCRAEFLAAKLKEASEGGGAAAAAAASGSSFGPSSSTSPSPAVSEDEVRTILLELRAVSKGAVPYLVDEGHGRGGVARDPDELPSLLDDHVHEDGLTGDKPGAGGPVPAALLDAPLVPRPQGLPRLVGVRGDAGQLALALSCGRPLSRLSARLRALWLMAAAALTDDGARSSQASLGLIGEMISAKDAVRNTLLLLRVVAITVSDRTSTASLVTQQQLLHVTRRTCSLRGGGRPKHQPRANLLCKLALRHCSRLSATAHGAAWRTPAFMPLITLQVRLATHSYASVRASAQAGFGSALRTHPWLARLQLPAQIATLSSPTAAYHETKGAVFLLGSRGVLRRVSSDWSLLCSTLIALCDAPDHARPKLQQRCRNLFSHVLEQTALQLKTKSLTPLTPLMAQLAQTRDVPGVAKAALAEYYAAGAVRDGEVCRRAVDELLLRAQTAQQAAADSAARAEQSSASPPPPQGADSPPSPATPVVTSSAPPAAASTAANGLQLSTHWSREVCFLCALVVLPVDALEQRAVFAACAARGLCSATAAVRKLARAAVSMLLSRPRPRGAALLRPCARPVDIFAPLPATDAEWEACEPLDKLLAGWATASTYVAPPRKTDPHAAVAPLGAVADGLLTEAAFLRRALEWLVTDHAEVCRRPLWTSAAR